MFASVDLNAINIEIGLGYLMLYIGYAICVLAFIVPLLWYFVLYIEDIIKDVVKSLMRKHKEKKENESENTVGILTNY